MPRTSSRGSSASAETVVALATPPGPSLRAVVRLSGPGAAEIARGVPGAVLRRAPRTYTREDLVEIHLPGSPPLVEALLRDLVARGARPARPGEFTLRAFLNGRIDLVQAEAVEQLISAEGEEELRAALGQLGGGLSGPIARLESGLLDLAADAEAALDFPEEDLELVPLEAARRRAGTLREAVRALRAESAPCRAPGGRPVAALFGPANAGKSSLFNALAGADALVSPVAGTTRDVLAADLERPLPLRLLDAAGVGEGGAAGPAAEAERRAREAACGADLVLFVVDASDWARAVPLEPRGAPVLLVVNKCDLVPGDAARAGFAAREAALVSARTGEGLEALREALGRMLGASGSAGGRFRLNLRQRAALLDAEAALDRAAEAEGLELAALDLRAALAALAALSGRDAGEELLDRVFSRFCLGK